MSIRDFFSTLTDKSVTMLGEVSDNMIQKIGDFINHSITKIGEEKDNFIQGTGDFIAWSFNGLSTALDNFFKTSVNLFNNTVSSAIDVCGKISDGVINFPAWLTDKVNHSWPFINFLSPHQKNQGLWLAIRGNDAAKLQIFINAGANIEAESDGMTPLMKSAETNNIALVKILIKAGASIDNLDDIKLINAYTALKYAFLAKHIEMCQYLLDAMSPEQIQIEFEKASNSQELKNLIHGVEIKKLQAEMFRLCPKNKASFSFENIPTEILSAIFAKKYLILTPAQILENIKFTFEIVRAMRGDVNPVIVDEPLLIVEGPQPVIFRPLEITTEANKTTPQITDITDTNDTVVDVTQDENKKSDLKNSLGL